jgi:peroxiredoxin family protein
MSNAIPQTMVDSGEHTIGHTTPELASGEPKIEGLSMVVFSGDLDKALAAFIIANGAAAMDLPVHMFFTFWGLNILRRGTKLHPAPKKTTTEGMFGRMMPNGPSDLHLSKMNMAGLGTAMIKREMVKKHVSDLAHLIQAAREQGVHFIACQMSMDLMGFKKEELIDGITVGNVGSFIDAADKSRITLFV